MRCVVYCGSTSLSWLVFFFGALLRGRKDGFDKGAHQSYVGAERNTLVNPNWFQPCQCCCCLCYPGEYLRLGTLFSYNGVQVLEACDCLKLLFIHFDLCVAATGVVCHQFGLLGTDLHAVVCGGFVETINSFCQFFFLSC